MPKFSFIHQVIIFLLINFFCHSLCYSLPQDKLEIIHFSAGTIEWDQLEHRGRFTDNVSFQQGTTKLFATSGVAIGDEHNQFNQIILFGTQSKQAHFITIPKPNDKEVHAYANKMVYLPQKKLIKLYGKVYVTQGRFHFKAPFMQYDLDKKKVITKPTQQEQTSILIDPEKS
jgi:lipopolysaccharide transport protein LptA